DALERRRERRDERARSRRPSGWPAWALWAAGVPLALVVLGTFMEVAFAAGRIHPGVRVGDVRVGGLGREAAAGRITEQLGPRVSAPVTVTYGAKKWTVDAKSIDASLSASGFVDAAYAVGRTGPWWQDLAVRASAWVRPVRVPCAVAADPDAVDEVLDLISGEVRIDPVDATVRISGTSAEPVPAADGLDIVRGDLTTRLLEAFVSQARTVQAPSAKVPVQVTDADAAKALADAKLMLSGPANVTFEKSTWEFPATAIAKWIVFEEEPATGTVPSADSTAPVAAGVSQASVRNILVARIGSDEMSSAVLSKAGAVVVEPKDASFAVSNGAVSIVPHQDGTGPDLEKLAADLTVALTTDGDRTVEMRTARMQPAITTEKAKTMGIRERLATYTTSYSPSNKPRVNNIHLLADALDGALVAPGATFSFNGHIGPRTAAKGYQEAPAIVGNKLVPQLGGGICQVGTTIFNAVFFSGLPTVERHNHSFYISHYPKGRDATVSFGGPDFKFKNDTADWVLIKTAHSAGTVTISLYGTDPGYEVEYETGAFENVKPHGVVEKDDPTLTVGSRVVEDEGEDGKSVVVTRIVKKGGQVIRTDTFKSVYKVKTEVVRVGTKPVSTPTSSTPTTH
ncbi:MAG: hypothetical protein FDZ70_03965, partial [Actinobacteria bacterium]